MTNKTVPVEPTEEMIAAAKREYWEGKSGRELPLIPLVTDLYKAMIAAAPEQPVYLPKITQLVWEQFEGTSLVEGTDWSQDAVDFACLLNQHRHPAPEQGELERFCDWQKSEMIDVYHSECWSTSCGQEFAIEEEWHEKPTNYCHSCGGKTREINTSKEDGE